MKFPQDTFGGRLRISIRKEGLTIAELCRLSGYNRRNLHNVLNDRQGMKLHNLSAVILCLTKTDVRWLICGKEY